MLYRAAKKCQTSAAGERLFCSLAGTHEKEKKITQIIALKS